MVRKRVTADVDTDQLQDVIRATLAANLANAGTPEGAAVAAVAGGGGSTPDATTSVKGKVKLAGDLGGTADLPTVPGLAGKAATVHTHAQADVGLSNVNNTSDANKPVSTAQAAADTAVAAASVAKALVDAKGDLLVATGADTVARLAVGQDGLSLTADSGSAKGVSWKPAKVEVRRNLHTNPVPASTTGFTGANAATTTFDAAKTAIAVAPAVSNGDSGTDVFRYTAVEGETLTISMDLESELGDSYRIVGSGSFGASMFTLAAGEKRRIAYSFTFGPAPMSGVIYVVRQSAGTTGKFWISKVLVGSGTTYFDGSTPDCAWLGIPNASESVMLGAAAPAQHSHAYIPYPAITAGQSSWWTGPAKSGTRALTGGAMTYRALVVGQPITITACRLQVTTAGAAGATLRAGIYSSPDGGSPINGVLLGTVLSGAGDAVATIATTGLSLTLQPGLYWLGILAVGTGVTITGALDDPFGGVFQPHRDDSQGRQGGFDGTTGNTALPATATLPDTWDSALTIPWFGIQTAKA